MSEPAVYSDFASDPDFVELVQHFVVSLPAKVLAIRKAAEAPDPQHLRELVHQLKGAAGSYGFGGISAALVEVERALRSVPQPVAMTILGPFFQLCERVRAGVPAQGLR